MKFIIQKDDLISGLSVASKASAARSPQPVLECVSMTANSTGLHLQCTDLQMGIETDVPAAVSEEGRVLLNARLFYEIVRKLPDGEVTVTVSTANRATISAGGSKTTLQGMSPVDFPQMPYVSMDEPIVISEKLLRDMITKTGFAVAQEDTRPILMGINMEVTEDTMILTALDGFRLAQRKGALSAEAAPRSAVISGHYFLEVAKILGDSEEDITLFLSETHLKVRTKSATFVLRLLEGEFIKYRQLLPAVYAITTRLSRNDLADCIDRASLMAREGKSNLLKFAIGQDALTITSNSEMGDVFEQMDCETIGKDIDIAFNVRYITEAVRSIDDEQFIIKLNSNITPCVLVPTEGDDFLYLVLPVRTL